MFQAHTYTAGRWSIKQGIKWQFIKLNLRSLTRAKQRYNQGERKWALNIEQQQGGGARSSSSVVQWQRDSVVGLAAQIARSGGGPIQLDLAAAQSNLI